jgi:hypothetical protein
MTTKIRHFRHRKDDNHDAIVRACRQAGLLVEDVHNGGLCDILIGFRGHLYAVEIKAPGKRKALTPKQKEKRLLWETYVFIVESAEELIKTLGLL